MKNNNQAIVNGEADFTFSYDGDTLWISSTHWTSEITADNKYVLTTDQFKKKYPIKEAKAGTVKRSVQDTVVKKMNRRFAVVTLLDNIYILDRNINDKENPYMALITGDTIFSVVDGNKLSKKRWLQSSSKKRYQGRFSVVA